jgi:hypothetical protein
MCLGVIHKCGESAQLLQVRKLSEMEKGRSMRAKEIRKDGILRIGKADRIARWGLTK